MKITAEVSFSPQEIERSHLTKSEFDQNVFNELTIRFAQELRKMNPLLSKEEIILEGTYFDSVQYKVQAIVLSNATFFSIMKELRKLLEEKQFEKIREMLINQI